MTLVAASLGFAVIQLDVFVVNVAVKQIAGALGGGTSGLQWVVGVYTLMFAALILTGGALGDRFGARRIYSVGFVVFVVASMACGLAPDMVVLVVARALQGAGAALLGSCSLALLNHTFRAEEQRSRAVGIWAAGASVRCRRVRSWVALSSPQSGGEASFSSTSPSAPSACSSHADTLRRRRRAIGASTSQAKWRR